MNLDENSFVLYSYDDGVLATSKDKELLEEYRVKYLSYNISVSDPCFDEYLSDLTIYEVPEVTHSEKSRLGSINRNKN